MVDDNITKRKESLLRVLQSRQNEEAHQAVEKKILGKLLMVQGNVGNVLPMLHNVDFKMFDDALNSFLFQSMKKALEKGSAIDIQSLDDDMKVGVAKDLYVKAGGLKYLTKLISLSNGNSAGLETLVNDFVHLNERKKLILNSVDFVNQLDQTDDARELEQLLINISRNLSALNNATENGSQPFKQIVQDWNNLLYEQRLFGTEAGTPVGYNELDKKLGGIRDGQFIVLGARPGTGKTAFTLNLVQNIVKEDPNKHVLMFSLEMGSFELMERIVTMNTAINSRLIKTNQLDDAQWADIATYLHQNENSTSFYINDNPGVSIGDVEVEMQKVIEQTDSLDLVVIDYLQLLNTEGTTDRQQAIAAISRRIKLLAKKYHVPILALSQLNRSAASAGERPGLHNLRESGQIEQDADIVMMLSQKDNDDEEDEENGGQENEYSTITEIICDVVKNRSRENGPTPFIFHKDISFFREMTPEEIAKSEAKAKETNSSVNEVKETDIKDIFDF